MTSIIEFIKNIQKTDFYNNVNLHIHTKASDGMLDILDILELAIKNNLKTISITDHNTTEAYKSIDLSSIKCINLITGVEFDCWYKTNFLHILGYGIDINNENLQKLCAKSKKETELDIIRIFSSRKSQQVIDAIHKAGGVAILAHPACCWNLNIKKMIKELKQQGLDGVEVYYPYKRHRGVIKFHTIKKIETIANELNLLITGGTDAHSDNLF